MRMCVCVVRMCASVCVHERERENELCFSESKEQVRGREGECVVFRIQNAVVLYDRLLCGKVSAHTHQAPTPLHSHTHTHSTHTHTHTTPLRKY